MWVEVNDGRNSRFRCMKCMSESRTKARKKKKKKAIDYLGGKCSKCGYNKCDAALEFHHIEGKDREPAKLIAGSWKKLQPELDKCILVCANCHREIHN